MAKRQPSPKQQQILKLIKDQPGIPVRDIADNLNTTEGAVYQHISRLRSANLLPKKARKRRPQLHEPKASGQSTELVTLLPSLEDHLASELSDTNERIKEIELRRIELDAEAQRLTRRSEKLTAAQEALTSS